MIYILNIYTYYGNLLLDSYIQDNIIFNGFTYFHNSTQGVLCIQKQHGQDNSEVYLGPFSEKRLETSRELVKANTCKWMQADMQKEAKSSAYREGRIGTDSWCAVA